MIVITTKKGKYGQALRVSFSSNVRIQQKEDLYRIPQITTSELIDVQKDLFTRGYYDGNLSNVSTFPVIPQVAEILDNKRKGKITATEADAQINSLRNIDLRDELNKYVYRSSVSKQGYLSFSGGTNQVNYKLSLGYDYNLDRLKGPGGDFARYSVSTQTSFKPFKFLEMNVVVNYTQQERSADAFPTGDLMSYSKLADEEGNYLAVPRTYRMSFVDTAGAGKLLDWHYRPLDEMQMVDNKNRIQTYNINIGNTIRLTPWLSANIILGYRHQANFNRDHKSVNTYEVRDLINRFTQLTPVYKRNIPYGGILDIETSDIFSYNLRGGLNLNKSWGKHRVTALVTSDIAQNNSKNAAFGLYGYNDNLAASNFYIDYITSFVTYPSGAARNIPNRSGVGETLNRTIAISGNASYSYDERYNFLITARKDGSNLFGVTTNNRWKPLWSAGAGWKVSKENFYHLKWLPALGLRVSYGYTGNTNGSVSAVTTLAYGPGVWPNIGLPYANINLGNPNLRWEEVRILNFGIDFSLKKRLSGSLELFQKNSYDVIAGFPIDPATGQSTLNRNAAQLSGKGIDVNLNLKNMIGPVEWNAGLNFNYCKTIVTKYYHNFIETPASSPSINPHVGQIAYGVYSYRWAGLDNVGDPLGYLGKQISKDYKAILNDSFQFQKFHGSSLPLYFGNIINTFSLKGFSLSTNILYRFDFYFRRPTIDYGSLMRGREIHGDFRERWQKPGDELLTYIPSYVYPENGNRDQFYNYSEIFVHRGDIVKMLDMKMSYRLNFRNGKKSPFQGVNLSLFVTNLNFVLWRANKSYLDPDYSAVPPPKEWAIGVSFDLK